MQDEIPLVQRPDGRFEPCSCDLCRSDWNYTHVMKAREFEPPVSKEHAELVEIAVPELV